MSPPRLLRALVAVGCILCGGAAFAQQSGEPDASNGAGRDGGTPEAAESQYSTEADRLFFVGRALKAGGRFPEAIKVFRDVLRLEPNYINARRELAHTLLLDRDFGPAEFHFRELLRIDRNEAMRRSYRRFLNIIDQERPVGVSGYFSIVPSTNVNRGTDNTSLVSNIQGMATTGTISESSRRRSGTGVSFGVSGYFRAPSGPTSRLSLNWGLSGVRYPDTFFNRTTLDLSLTHEEITRWGSWNLGPYYRRNYREDGGDSDSHGARFGVTRRLNEKNQIGFSVSHEYTEYRMRRGSDGHFTSYSTRLRHQVRPSVGVSAGVGFTLSTPERESNRYHGRRVFGDVTKRWRGGLRTTAGVEYGQRRYKGIFPLSGVSREDHYTTMSLSVLHSRIDVRGFTPQMHCSRTNNRSNIAISEFGATECQMIISRNF